MSTDDEHLASIAHVLRRLTFGPFPGQVEDHAGGSPADLVEAVLAEPEPELDDPPLGTDDDKASMVKWWLERMAGSGSPLHERMTWFWHGHFTSSFAKVDQARAMAGQHRLLRQHALGNFRELAQALTVDAAMLQYLDGAWSTGESPNENYARELMELFTLGRGAYGEEDVRAAAKGLAGWTLDDEQRVSFDPERAFHGQLTLLGRTGELDANAVVDTICDAPACAPFIVSKLHDAIVGTPLSDARRSELASIFTASGLEIRPVIEALVRHPSFLEPTTRYARIRGPVEWYTAASQVLGAHIDPGVLWGMGQVPFWPPNVAGWPGQQRWLNAGVTLQRAGIARDNAWDAVAVDSDDHATWALRRAGIFDATAQTVEALRRSVAAVESRRDKSTVALSLVVSTPEFVLC